MREDLIPPSGVTSIPEPLIFNLARLQAFTGQDPVLDAELLRLFQETALLYLERLERALVGDGSWQAAAHALKGASSNIGAESLAAAAARAEAEPPTSARLAQLREGFAAFEEATADLLDGQT